MSFISNLKAALLPYAAAAGRRTPMGYPYKDSCNSDCKP